MPQRTDIFELGRLGLRSGDGRRFDLNVSIGDFDYAGEPYAVTPALVPVRLDLSRTTGMGWALRLRFTAGLAGPCMRCLDPAEPSFEIDVREVSQPGGGEELSSPYLAEDEELHLGQLGARRAGARAARADHLPRGLRRPLRAMRREPQRRARPRARGGARPALGEARRAEVRVAP